MHPPLSIKTILHTNARHTAGRFAFCYFPQEIPQELTKVNKPGVTKTEPNTCKDTRSPIIKQNNSIVNKMAGKRKEIHGEKRKCVSTNSIM